MASAPGTNQVCYLKPNVPSPSVALQLTSSQDYAFKTTPFVLGATSNLLDTAWLGSDHKAVVLNVGKRAAVAFTFKKIGFCSYSRATGNFGDTDLCARAIANGRLWQMMNVW